MRRKEHQKFFVNLYIQMFKWFLKEKNRITFNYIKVFVVFVCLMGPVILLSRNIDRQDIFKDKQNVISGILLSLVLLALMLFFIVLFASAVFVFFQGVF